ncbi:hypothetical protein [Novispirillum itersonii]|uniref:Solute-binding protein family 3/N-terminal domain-containing protein n=1 Tax=Novispirillum itersonii TaxID=189 RepID=A0A7X0DLV1_NOVIT|nr:hypothetical protein [Novispirillum itersonii]MBB6210360.1 hypothetical protein [Novispirillum itersonii]
MLWPFLRCLAVSTGLAVIAAHPGAAADAVPKAAESTRPPLTIAYSNGAKGRFLQPATPDEDRVLRQIQAAGDAVLTPLPVIRAPAAFLGRSTDCLLGSPWQIPADTPQAFLVSPALMTARFSFFRHTDPAPAPDRPLRLAINREIAAHLRLPDSLSTAEVIQVNDISQSVKLLLSRRVDYIVAYDGNMRLLPDDASRQIRRAETLPPAFEKPIAITCHNTPQAVAFLTRLTAAGR